MNKRGSSMPAVIGGIVLILIIVGSFYYASQMREMNEVGDEDGATESKEMGIMDGSDEVMIGDNMGDDHGSSETETMMEGSDEAMMGENGDGSMSADGGAGEMMVGDKTKTEEVIFTGTVLAGNEAKLLDFNKEDYDKAIASDKLVALYFYASWCPICRAEFSKMESAFNSINTDEVVGFRVNFNDNDTDDFEKDLAREFSVSYQHTKVFVRNGERVLKSPESWSKSRYITEINNLLNN